MRNRPLIFDFEVRKKAKVCEMDRVRSSSGCGCGRGGQKLNKKITYTIIMYV